jgi:hypothetical protein
MVMIPSIPASPSPSPLALILVMLSWMDSVGRVFVVFVAVASFQTKVVFPIVSFGNVVVVIGVSA